MSNLLWWHHDLSAKPSIDHNILKARKSFFAYGSMGVFQGDLSPLSGRLVVDTCILPILFYGAENWCLSHHSLEILDSFLGELCKRLLKLPKWYTNTPASIVIGLGSARAMCLTRKLSFLRKMCSEDHNEAVSSRTLASLSDDLDSICLIRECRDLDNYFLSDFTSVILQREADTCPIQAVINEEILSKDRKLRLAKHEGRPDLSVVVEVEEAIGWPKLWDLALDRGPNCIHGLRNFVRIVTYPPHATSPCPLCEDKDVPRVSLLSHVIGSHMSNICDSCELLSLFSLVTDSDSTLFNYLCSFSKLF